MMLYVHIPFCIKKCGYCDFLSFEKKAIYWEPYVSALCNEIVARSSYANEPVTSIYIGGGTPSILSVRLLTYILDTIYVSYDVAEDAEVTLECNPATVTKDSAEELSLLPINRVSIGLQSANENELKRLGRAHSLSDFLFTYECFLKSGIDNINVDIMTGIPEQDVSSLQNTLKTVLSLRPAHISTYALSLEEGTRFYSRHKSGFLTLPDEDTEYAIYKSAISTLKEHGYERYEVSNYARPGKASRHNLGYWDRLPYLGFGLGAASFFDHTRYKNITNLDKYIGLFSTTEIELKDEDFEEVTPLSKRDEVAEFMYLGLRKTDGILFTDFEVAFGERIDAYYYKVIERLQAEGQLIKSFGRICISEESFDIMNDILWEFLPD